MFNAKVYKISVISLSGIMEEVFAAKECVRQWNVANAERTGKLFLTVDEPQAADVLVGVVDNHLGNTALVEECLKTGRQVLLLFNAFYDPRNTMSSEQSAVADFMNHMGPRCYCAKFNGARELNGLLNEQLNEIQ